MDESILIQIQIKEKYMQNFVFVEGAKSMQQQLRAQSMVTTEVLMTTASINRD
jgi:hypothetical protein